ncbi:MAG: hypothetical protein HSCHL_0583 [Hydrogenibacillus schlegelii]|uniref:Uncharacterized protein n=1 Tax=Hydrogenibacillus schlegelii TaxID=1484 RepID=A0A2T5GDP3_HYDSH|nr:MAG: hypothetical protein HSCHL_0583 [Hydrogenibacillus schlegelii]
MGAVLRILGHRRGAVLTAGGAGSGESIGEGSRTAMMEVMQGVLILVFIAVAVGLVIALARRRP